jgi:peptidoglycan/LPS O-acetylase OafA/YrhL
MAALPKLRPQSDEMLHLDLTRFIASVGIVAHHSIEYFVQPSSRDWLHEKTMGLALFVDLFFVISGFVIAYVYHERALTLKGYAVFLQRRVGRLVPLHWLTLAISLAIDTTQNWLVWLNGVNVAYNDAIMAGPSRSRPRRWRPVPASLRNGLP